MALQGEIKTKRKLRYDCVSANPACREHIIHGDVIWWAGWMELVGWRERGREGNVREEQRLNEDCYRAKGQKPTPKVWKVGVSFGILTAWDDPLHRRRSLLWLSLFIYVDIIFYNVHINKFLSRLQLDYVTKSHNFAKGMNKYTENSEYCEYLFIVGPEQPIPDNTLSFVLHRT